MEYPTHRGGGAIESLTTQQHYQLALAPSGVFLSNLSTALTSSTE